jgi:hypothetical protein
MSNQAKLKEIVRKIIKKEVEEASTSSATPGYQTPMAFSGGRKKDKKKKKKIANAAGYSVVKEEITSAGYSEIGKRGRYLPLAAKEFIKALKKQDDREVIKNIEYIADLMDFMKDALKNKKYNESINEGKYHDYRNDESMTPKQKIGRSMREIRDSLNNLDKLVKMNVRLKNELKVDSRSYWKNTHKALNKISERLVKLANKVGQLQ